MNAGYLVGGIKGIVNDIQMGVAFGRLEDAESSTFDIPVEHVIESLDKTMTYTFVVNKGDDVLFFNWVDAYKNKKEGDQEPPSSIMYLVMQKQSCLMLFAVESESGFDITYREIIKRNEEVTK